jgi:hypothetical protein
MKTEDTPDKNTVGRDLRSGWTHDPDLVNINEMRIPPPEVSGYSEDDVKKDIKVVWNNLMLHLCGRHRTNKRSDIDTDYRIEDLRKEKYGAFTDANYFRELMRWVAKQHREVEVEGDIIRLTRSGFDKCEKYDRTFQRDIEY